MKKNIKVKVLATGLCVVLAGTTAYGLHYNNPVDTKEIIAHAEDQQTVTEEDNSSGEGSVDKKESVFVTTDAAGTPTDIIVSDWLDNTKNYKTITDQTTLSEVENVKSNNEITQEGENLTIDAKGSDIYYRGTVDASTQLPVSLDISYTLDGKTVTAADLDDVTGHLVMNIKYTNNTSTTETVDGKDYEVCVPFLATSVMAFDTANVTNIQAVNAKVLETGTKCIFAGFAFPGINKSFGLTDQDGVFTDTVTFEADVTNYKPQMIMSYYSTEVFSNSDLDGAVNTADVMNAFSKITNISTDKFNDIKNMDDITEAMDTLKASATELNDGMITLQTGVGELDAKVALLNDGMQQAYDGSSQLATALKTAAASTSDLNAGAKQVSDGATALDAGVDQLVAGLASMTTNIDGGISAYGAATPDGATAILAKYETYQTELTTAYGTQAVIDALNTSKDNIDATLVEQSALYSTTVDPTTKAGIGGAINALTTVSNELAAKITALSSTAPMTTIVASKTPDSATGMTPTETYLSQFGDTTGSIGAAAALTSVKKGMTDADLSGNVAKLKAGSSQLASGAKQVYTGTGALLTGLNTLSSKTNELAAALKQLSEGTDLLKDGTSQLVDGTSQLADGTSQLATLFDGDVSALVNTSTALKNAAKNYTTYTATSKDSNSKVSFIIKTE